MRTPTIGPGVDRHDDLTLHNGVTLPALGLAVLQTPTGGTRAVVVARAG